WRWATRPAILTCNYSPTRASPSRPPEFQIGKPATVLAREDGLMEACAGGEGPTATSRRLFASWILGARCFYQCFYAAVTLRCNPEAAGLGRFGEEGRTGRALRLLLGITKVTWVSE